jgi:hypothetical protein
MITTVKRWKMLRKWKKTKTGMTTGMKTTTKASRSFISVYVSEKSGQMAAFFIAV